MSYFSTPYLSSLSKQFLNITKDLQLNVKLSYFSLNKLRNYIKVHKDVIPKFSNTNVVYKIECTTMRHMWAKQAANQALESKNKQNHTLSLNFVDKYMSLNMIIY